MDDNYAISATHIAIVVDDLATDRQLAGRALRRSGWTVHPARNSFEGLSLIEQHIDGNNAPHTIILTDLHMPGDPVYGRSNHKTAAGSQFALQLRARMEQGALPRMPIIALTALTELEIYTTALAFGCDAVLPKPATPDLAERITSALTQATIEETDPVGAAALLRLLRRRLAETLTQPKTPLTEQDITRALLAYHRQGINGIGRSSLASFLAGDIDSIAQRGEHTYMVLLRCLNDVTRLGIHESARLLQGELVHQKPPAEQAEELGVSPAEYYRRRREAVSVVFELLVDNRERGT